MTADLPPEDDNPHLDRPLRSFGRIKARPIKPRQAALMETLLPALFHLLLALSIRICKLNNPMMSRIATDLRQRHVQP